MRRKHEWRCANCGYILGEVAYKPFKALNLFEKAVETGDGKIVVFGMAHGRVICSHCQKIREWRIDDEAIAYFDR